MGFSGGDKIKDLPTLVWSNAFGDGRLSVSSCFALARSICQGGLYMFILFYTIHYYTKLPNCEQSLRKIPNDSPELRDPDDNSILAHLCQSGCLLSSFQVSFHKFMLCVLLAWSVIFVPSYFVCNTRRSIGCVAHLWFPRLRLDGVLHLPHIICFAERRTWYGNKNWTTCNTEQTCTRRLKVFQWANDWSINLIGCL